MARTQGTTYTVHDNGKKVGSVSATSYVEAQKEADKKYGPGLAVIQNQSFSNGRSRAEAYLNSRAEAVGIQNGPYDDSFRKVETLVRGLNYPGFKLSVRRQENIITIGIRGESLPAGVTTAFGSRTGLGQAVDKQKLDIAKVQKDILSKVKASGVKTEDLWDEGNSVGMVLMNSTMQNNDTRPYVAYKSPNGNVWFVGRGGMGSSTGHRFKTEAEAKAYAQKLNDQDAAKREHEDWAEDRKAALARGEVRRGVRGY